MAARAKRGPGRPKKPEAEKEKPLRFKVQPDLHAYLRLLAGARFAEGSPDQMARLILIEACEERRRNKYLGIEFNPPSESG
jgi:hypothetical protein